MSPHDPVSPARRSAPAHAARFTLLLLWCGAVWYLSAQPDPGDTVGFHLELPDWLLHGIEYAAGGFLARHALAPVLRSRGRVVALAFLAVWALLDEWHQSFVPGRDAAALDVAADVVGALVGVAVHRAWARRRGA